MTAVTIGLPAAFFGSSSQSRDFALDARTVGEALRRLADEHPQYAPRIFYGERLLVAVTLNGRHLAPPVVKETPLDEGDRVDLLLPVAGG